MFLFVLVLFNAVRTTEIFFPFVGDAEVQKFLVATTAMDDSLSKNVHDVNSVCMFLFLYANNLFY